MKVSTTPLFLHPANKITDVWYSRRPVGENTIANVTKKLCADAGITGYYTGHSLRRTGITRMFQGDVPEKIIKEVSGHRSNSVDQYKVTSIKQKANVSNIIQGEHECNRLIVCWFVFVVCFGLFVGILIFVGWLVEWCVIALLLPLFYIVNT